MKKMLLATALVAASFATVSMTAVAADQALLDRFSKSCNVCHSGVIPTAPKAFDAQAWKPRLAKGMDKLLVSVKGGLNAMPPKGMCNDCTDADYKALITYMSTPKK